MPKNYSMTELRRNMVKAWERDNGLCQWCLRIDGVESPGATPHHIYGRGKDISVHGVITLCYRHHTWFHTAHQVEGVTVVTREKLVNLIKQIEGAQSG